MPIVSASYINQHCQLMQGMKRRPQARRCNKAVWGMSGMRVLQNLQKAIAARLRDEILVTPRVELVESNSLPRTEGKAVRLQDMRNKN